MAMRSATPETPHVDWNRFSRGRTAIPPPEFAARPAGGRKKEGRQRTCRRASADAARPAAAGHAQRADLVVPGVADIADVAGEAFLAARLIRLVERGQRAERMAGQ